MSCGRRIQTPAVSDSHGGRDDTQTKALNERFGPFRPAASDLRNTTQGCVLAVRCCAHATVTE